MRILIRADASRVIGLGHVMRCLTLANALRSSGAEIVFACRELLGHYVEGVLAQGHQVIRLPFKYNGDVSDSSVGSLDWQADLAALLPHLSQGFDLLIVDHYGLDARWERAMRAYVSRVMVIDDLCNRAHDADILLDQNLSADASAYQQWVAPSCQLLLGPKYVLLRPEFIGEPIQIKPTIERILVNFGGSDPTREMLKTMDALQDMGDIHIDFVAGISNPALPELQQRATEHPDWHVLPHVDDFAALMRAADLFIGAAGSTSWERAALGLPSVCISVALNQTPNAQLMQAMGAHCYLGEASILGASGIREQLRTISFWDRKNWAITSHQLVDGRGAARVVASILHSSLKIRLVASADAALLFVARNSPEVRRQSLQFAPIDWVDHLTWLQTKLDDPHSLLLLGEVTDGAVGVVRFDLVDTGIAEVSIYLLSERLQQGWGMHLLKVATDFMLRSWSDISAIRAVIKDDNAASLALFARAGYVSIPPFYIRNLKENRDE